MLMCVRIAFTFAHTLQHAHTAQGTYRGDPAGGSSTTQRTRTSQQPIDRPQDPRTDFAGERSMLLIAGGEGGGGERGVGDGENGLVLEQIFVSEDSRDSVATVRLGGSGGRGEENEQGEGGAHERRLLVGNWVTPP